jgi:gas vesicle protein
MSNNDDRDSGMGLWLFGLFLGVLGGATIAILTAPKSGTEMRGQLKETARTMPDRVTNIVDDSLDLYATGVNYLQVIMEEQTMRLKRAVAAGKLAAAKKREEIETGGSSVLPFQHR